MAKKGGFSFDGMVDASTPSDPIAGVVQRGAVEPVKQVRRGRPAKVRTATEARPSFGLDPMMHAKFKIWLLKNGMSMQDYLERHIADLVKDIEI